MATILDDEDSKDKQSQGEQVLSNGSGTIEGQGSAQASPGQGQGQPGGGGFTNLQQYVTANEGNDAQMGQKVESNVQGNAQAADSAIGNYQSQAGDAIKQGTVTQDSGVQQALKDSPEKIVGDSNLKSAFDKQYNAQFTGDGQASNYQGYNEATGAANKVQSQGQAAAGDNSARRGLLNDVYARPDYGTGQQNLDSFILGAGQGGQQALQRINQNYGQYGQKATDAAGAVQKQIGDAQATSNATKDATRNLLAQQTGSYDTKFKGLQSYADQQAQTQQSDYQGTIQGLSSKDAAQRAAAFQHIGLDPKAGEFLVSEGYSPSQLIQAGQAKKLGDYADQTDETHYNALRQLGGQGSDYDFTKSNGNGQAFIADQGKIGAAGQAQGLVSGLQSKLQQQQDARDAQYQQLMGNLNSFKGSESQQALNQLGVSQADYQYARDHGIDPSQFIQAGRKLNLGDVSDDSSRGQFTNLMAMLGLKGQEDLGYHGSAGNAYTFDNGAFGNQLSQLRAKDAALAAANQPRTGGSSTTSPAPPQGTPLNTGVGGAVAGAANTASTQADKQTGGYVSKAKKKLGIG